MQEKISIKDKIKLYSALYTYNHGNKSCTLLEYSLKIGDLSDKYGNYNEFRDKLKQIGYNVKDIVFIKNNYKLLSDAEAFEERKKKETFVPSDVDYFIVGNNKVNYILKESIESLELLANSNDNRAYITYHNCLEKLNHIDNGINKLH